MPLATHRWFDYAKSFLAAAKEAGDNVISTLRRVFGIGVTWAIVWLSFWTIVGGSIAVVDPDSIDPGEGSMFIVIFGSMGFFSGIAFGILLSIAGRGRTITDLSLARVAAWGMLGCAIVQVGYLGHGDQGLAANIQMALLFSAFGGLVTTVWILMARKWSHRRNASYLRGGASGSE